MLPNYVARATALLALAAVAVAVALAVELRPQDSSGEAAHVRDGAPSRPTPPAEPPRQAPPGEARHGAPDEDQAVRAPIAWRESVAVGEPEAGRLVRGVRLPREGAHFFTWDPIRRESPNRT